MKRLMMILLALALLLPALPACAEPAQAPTLETLSELEWMFCSGVGAWSTLMWIEPDGTFIGDFHDSDMGDIGEGYPDGTIYFCRFHGRLSMGEQVSEYAWRVHIDEVEADEGQSDRIEDDVRYILAYPYGLVAGDDMLLFLPGTPVDALPEGFLFWAHLIGEDADALPYYGLYDEAEDTGFTGEPLEREAF